MANVSNEIVRTQIAHVRKTVGEKHLTYSTKHFIKGLEKDMARGWQVTQQELYQLMEQMKSDLAFKGKK
jgi:hypothetical protein